MNASVAFLLNDLTIFFDRKLATGPDRRENRSGNKSGLLELKSEGSGRRNTEI
jgi:hypothetical protein